MDEDEMVVIICTMVCFFAVVLARVLTNPRAWILLFFPLSLLCGLIYIKLKKKIICR